MNELARISLFEKLDNHELSRLSTIVKRRLFPTDTVVFFEGDQSDSLYAIVAGSTKVYTTDDDGEEKVLTTMGPGEVFGEYSLIDGQSPLRGGRDVGTHRRLVHLARRLPAVRDEGA